MAGGSGTQAKPGFSKAIADAVIRVVKNDPTSVSRVSSWLSSVMPTGLGWTGSVRNLGYVVTLQDPTDPTTAAKVCTGIAEATSTAINRAIKSDKVPLVGVKAATMIDRVSPHAGVYHTATKVVTAEGGEAVFDWHATLEIDNPMISKVDDWLNCTGETPAKLFKGW
ncbi:MAG: hypothetical protein H6810_07770 [Phycisphaeraceae bacterium]|nr:MAG: hypothetical protein H6810_07770 [Phycisphaeraceae bacterium]